MRRNRKTINIPEGPWEVAAENWTGNNSRFTACNTLQEVSKYYAECLKGLLAGKPHMIFEWRVTKTQRYILFRNDFGYWGTYLGRDDELVPRIHEILDEELRKGTGTI
jgi:elongation factor P hydroxylase